MNQSQYPKNEVEMIIEKIKGLGKLVILPIAVLILFVAQPWVIVGPGQRGILMRLGAVQKGVLSEGFHFKMPFIDNVVKMNVQVQKNEAKADAASKDLQIISTVIATNYHLMPETVDEAEQKVAQAKNELDRIKIENEQKISQAKAEAEGLKIQRQEITESLLKLREIENPRKAIEKWDGKLPSVTGGTIPFIQVK